MVAGWNYEVTYTIAQTNCSKEQFLFLTPDCKSLLNGVSRQKWNDAGRRILCAVFTGVGTLSDVGRIGH